MLFFYHFFTALPFYLLTLACALAYLWETGRSWRVSAYLAVAIGTFAYFYPFVSGQPVPGSQAAIFFVLPTWQYDCQFYPSFVCPITAPADLPIAAAALRLAGAAAVAVLAAGAFYVLRAPDHALASARGALGRSGRRGSDAG